MAWCNSQVYKSFKYQFWIIKLLVLFSMNNIIKGTVIKQLFYLVIGFIP